MNTILLIVLTLIEAGLVVYSFSAEKSKNNWYRNRFIAGLAEPAVFVIFAFFPGIDYGTRFKALVILLVIRLLYYGILYLVRKNTTHQKKKAAIIFSAVLSVLIICVSLVPSFIIADYKGLTPSGSMKVLTTSAILTDTSRIEQFENDGSYREIPVDFYYPESGDDEKFPLVIFSHGAFGISRSNFSMYQELASNGYVVASLSHPYHSFFCKDTDGKTITVNPEFMQNALYINEEGITESEIFAISHEWIKLRTDDINCVLDSFERWNRENAFDNVMFMDNGNALASDALNKIDFDKIGIAGHSLGGAAAVNIGRIRNDISAVVDIDGTMLGEELEVVKCEPTEVEGKTYTEKYLLIEEPYPIAILNIDNQEHHDSRIALAKADMPYSNSYVMENALRGYDTYFVNSGHMNLTDLALQSPVAAKLLGTGSIDSKQCIEELNHLILNFLDCELKGTGGFVVEESYGN